MKKGKVFSKRHIVTATLVVCLAAAVWLNMKYSSFDVAPENNYGDKQFYDTNSNLGEAVQTQGSVATITTARNERNLTREESLKQLKNQIDSVDADQITKAEALLKYTQMTERVQTESSIETVLKAKGFNDVLAIVSDTGVTVIVASESLLTSETLQIQDAVTSQMQIDLEKIKIIAVK